MYIRFGIGLYRQIVGIPMGTNGAPLVADSFLFCYECHFINSLSEVNKTNDIRNRLNSRYLGDLLDIDTPYVEGMINQIIIYPPELQLNRN